MKYLDFGVQTFILTSAIVLLITRYFGTDWLIAILLAQLFLGGWQLLSATISVIVKAEYFKEKRTLLLTCIGYLVILIAGSNSELPLAGTFLLLFLTVPAWILALSYYVITCRLVFKRHTSGRFLRHINF